MPYTPRVKALAQKLDPECWISYSGKAVSTKRDLDAWRCTALDQAVKIVAAEDETRALMRRYMSAHIMFGPHAAEGEYAKIMKEIRMAPTLDEVRDFVRLVAMDGPGRECARKILSVGSGGRASKVADLWTSEYQAVINYCKVALGGQPNQSFTEREKMPPLKIKMMLHFGTVLGPFAPEHTRRSDAYVTFVRELLRDGMIERPSRAQRDEHTGWAYKATPKGQCYIAALVNTPLPVRTNPEWKMPSR